MNADWKKHTRKDRMEMIAARGSRLTERQRAVAWNRLMERMITLSSPEAHRLPKFNDLLGEIHRSSVRGKITRFGR